MDFKDFKGFEYNGFDSEKDTNAIQDTDSLEFAYVPEVYQPLTSASAPQYTMPLLPQQPKPTVLAPCKHFKDVVRQNIGTSYVRFWEVINNVLANLNLYPDVAEQHRAFANNAYSVQNPNAY